MKKYILTALLLIAVALPASAQILSLKAGISQDGAVSMNIPINNISGEVRLGRSFSAQATVGLRKHEDSRPGYSFKSRHLGLQFRSYILLRQNKFLNGLYVAASTMHSLFSSPDGNDNPIKSRTTNVGIGAGYQQTFLKIITIDGGMILNHPLEKGTQFPIKQYGAYGYLQLGLTL